MGGSLILSSSVAPPCASFPVVGFVVVAVVFRTVVAASAVVYYTLAAVAAREHGVRLLILTSRRQHTGAVDIHSIC